MSFMHVFGVNVDVWFIVFAVAIICALVLSVKIAMMKESDDNTDNNNDSNDSPIDLNFFKNKNDYKCSLTDSHYAYLEGNAFYTEDE